MKINLYSVRDNKIGFSNTWTARTEAEAVRNYEDALNDSRSALSKHPSDTELYYIGTWDDQTGIIESDVKYITNGIEKYKPQNKLDKLDEETLKEVVKRLGEIEINLNNAKNSQIEINKKLYESNKENQNILNQIESLKNRKKKFLFRR